MTETEVAAVQLFDLKEGRGAPLVFIHGWGASHRFWKHQISFFAQKNQIIAYDLRVYEIPKSR